MKSREIILFGKQIENNLIRLLDLAGVKVTAGAECDHNYKIDFIKPGSRGAVQPDKERFH